MTILKHSLLCHTVNIYALVYSTKIPKCGMIAKEFKQDHHPSDSFKSSIQNTHMTKTKTLFSLVSSYLEKAHT